MRRARPGCQISEEQRDLMLVLPDTAMRLA
jgi:hypothetical protein